MASITERVAKRRAALRQAGLRPVQLWVPDSRRPGFSAECARQCALAREADLSDAGLSDLMDATLADTLGWTP